MIRKYDLLKSVDYYKNILKHLKKLEFIDINGSLVIDNTNKSLYHKTKDDNGNTFRKYISVKNIKLAKNLANKSYYNKIKKLSIKRIYQIEKILKDYEDNEIGNIYGKLNPARKYLIDPVEYSYEEVLDKWKKEKYISKENTYNFPNIYTNRGEQVRSKSEKILADLFYDLGIEYKYECPLKLKNGKIFYPDFTFLHPITYEEIYWEHCGLMNDPDYVNSTLYKLKQYEMNGIYRNKNLIMTYETSDHSLDIQWVKLLIDNYLK